MQVLRATQQSYEGGIEFADLESVKNALRVFAAGGTAGSRETSRFGFDSGPAGGFGLAMKLLIDDRRESGFMQELLNSVDRVADSGWLHRSYDYDGVGPFFKTTVEVKRVEVGPQQFVYLLGLSAAYVGDQPCAGLAEALGADRALWRDEIVIEMAPVGDHFEFDFDTVMQRLSTIGLGTFTGQQVADHMMEQVGLGYFDRKLSIPLRDDDLLVTLGIVTYSVDGPEDRDTRQCVWKQNGSVISGPLAPSYEPDVQYATPRLYVSISMPENEGERSWDRNPIIDPRLKQAAHDQAAEILNAFQ